MSSSAIQFLFLLLVPVLLLVGIHLYERKFHRFSGPTLVLREFRVRNGNPADNLITVRGRPSGFFAFCLSFLHLDDLTSFVMSDQDLVVETASLHGLSRQYVTVKNITSSACGYHRSFSYLLASLSVFTLTFLTFLYNLFNSHGDYLRQSLMASERYVIWAGIALGSLLYLVYALSKRIVITVRTSGGATFGVAFKRSVIENVSIELPQAAYAVNVLNARLLANHETRVLETV